jgi:hypothetical protein
MLYEVTNNMKLCERHCQTIWVTITVNVRITIIVSKRGGLVWIVSRYGCSRKSLVGEEVMTSGGYDDRGRVNKVKAAVKDSAKSKVCEYFERSYRYTCSSPLLCCMTLDF